MTANLTKKPLFLWFLNHQLDPEEIKFQIKEFKKNGFGGFFIHWLNGGPPYMGREWLDSLKIIIENASREGLEAWLYDEAWCPSGFAGGRILARKPNLEACSLWHAYYEVKGSLDAEFDLMEVICAVALPDKNGIPIMENQIDLKEFLGTVTVGENIPYRHSSGYYAHALPPLEHWRQSAQKRVWKLLWNPPPGKWHVYICCKKRSLFSDSSSLKQSLDWFNPESVKEFIKETHEVYEQNFSKYFGNVIPGIMIDEPRYTKLPWSEYLLEYFNKCYKDNLLAKLPLLLDDRINDDDLLRVKYYRAVSDLFRTRLLEPLSVWCKSRNLLLTGHISPEEDPSHEAECAGNIAKNLELFDIPGTDLIMQAIGDCKRPALNLGPRLASSVAHQQGKSDVFVEYGACCNENLSLEKLKLMCDWLMVNGVNLFTFHGLVYSSKGYRKFITGQNLSCHNNLWKNIKHLNKYLEERRKLLIEYRPKRQIAVLKPHTALRHFTAPLNSEVKREEIDESLIKICYCLQENHYDFDLLDEDTNEFWNISGNSLVFQKAKYKLIIIPECDLIASETAVALKQFLLSGGKLICVGSSPLVLNEKLNQPLFQSIKINKLRSTLKSIIDTELTISGQNSREIMLYTGFNKQGKKLTILLNTSAADNHIKLTDKYGLNLSLSLEPSECKIIHEPDTESLKKALTYKFEKIKLNRDWLFKANEDNHIPLTSCKTVIVIDADLPCLYLVCEDEEQASIAANLKIDGKILNWNNIKRQTFYDHNNLVLKVNEYFTPGEHIVEFSENKFNTVLLAGRFSAMMQDDDSWTLNSEPKYVSTPSRIKAGYSYCRGILNLKNSFELKEDFEHNIQLHLPDRQGVVEVKIDSKVIGKLTWRPDCISVKNKLSKGKHEIEIEITGDGIGILRELPSEAGIQGHILLEQGKY